MVADTRMGSGRHVVLQKAASALPVFGTIRAMAVKVDHRLGTLQARTRIGGDFSATDAGRAIR